MAVYIPQTGLVYPKHQDEHMIVIKAVYDDVLDDKYPYFDTSFWFRFQKFFIKCMTWLVAFPISKIRYGFRQNGSLKKHRKELKNGCVSVCNHTFRWDYIFLESAVWPKELYHPSWYKNLKSRDRNLIRLSGGIPLPKNSGKSANVEFTKALNEVLKRKHCLHIFAEGSSWQYYAPIRHLKKGAFIFAYNHKVPVVPFAISFRKRGWLGKLFGAKSPAVTLNVGVPFHLDYDLPKGTAVMQAMEKCRAEMIRLAGFDSIEQNDEAMKQYKYADGVDTPAVTSEDKVGNY